MKYLILSLVVFSLVFCGGKKKEEALVSDEKSQDVTVTFFSGTVNLFRNGVEISPAQGMQLSPEDEIRTGKNGRMEVLVRKSGLLKISADTSLSISNLLRDGDSSDTNVHLNYGSIVTVVKKEKKTDNYNIVTPTLVAGVRGTVFSTTVENLDANMGRVACSGENCWVRVEVIDGKVAVRKKESTQEVVLEKNSQISSTGKKELEKGMVMPLGKESLERWKENLVFQNSQVGGFENLMEELKESSQELSEKDLSGGLEESRKVLSKKANSRSDDEVRKVADTVDTRKYLKKDLAKDKLKLESKESF